MVEGAPVLGRVRGVAVIAAVAILYAAGAWASWTWFRAGSIGLAFFPPAGVTLVGLIAVRRRLWPAVLAIAFVVEVAVDRHFHLAWRFALLYALANVLEPLVGAVLLVARQRRLGRSLDVSLRHDLSAFVAFGAIAGVLVGALVGGATKTLESHTPWSTNVVHWFAGDGLGVIAVGAPLAALASLRTRRRSAVAGWLGVAVVFGAIGLLAFHVFELAAPIIVVPALVVLAVRSDVPRVAVASLVICVIANRAGAVGDGPFAAYSIGRQQALALTQAFLVVCTITALFVAIGSQERAKALADHTRAVGAHRASELRAFAGLVASRVSGLSEPPAIVQVLDHMLRDRFGVQAVFICLWDAERARFDVYCSAGVPDGVRTAIASANLETAGPGQAAMRSSSPVLAVGRAALRRQFPFASGIADRVGTETLVALPVYRVERPVGYMALAWGEARELDDDELDVLERVSAVIAATLERARLFESTQAAVWRTERLQRASAALSHAASIDDIAAVWRECAAESGINDARLVLDGASNVAAGLDAGALSIAYPLRTNDVTSGSAVGWLRTPLGDADRAMLRATAELCSQAIERVRLAEFEHMAAQELQRALLGELDDVVGLSAAARYQPADQRLRAGGDWYDLIDRRDGTAVAVIGDVVGHGVEAAAVMGQLRSAVRALAPSSDDPVAMLAHLEGFIAAIPAARSLTVAILMIDLTNGEVGYACAGHPPPLLRRANRQTVILADGRSAPLAAAHAVDRACGRVHVEPGDLLVLYTDGLVERRSESIDRGIDRLRAAVTEAPADSRGLCERVARLMVSDTALRDDVALLCLSVRPDVLVHRMGNDVSHLASARQALKGWLVGIGIDDPKVPDVLLVASEALTNAAEHAYSSGAAGAPKPGVVELVAVLDGHELLVRVRDSGRWRTWPSAPDRPGRGRGTAIMEALADRVDIERRDYGTTVSARFALPPRHATAGSIDLQHATSPA